jgi:hypothetical protein
MAPIYTGNAICLQIQGYFICKYFGDIMQYGGICFIYILNIIILSNNSGYN